MSLENAILEHAAALREVAAAIRERSAPLGDLARQAQSAIAAIKADLEGGGTPLQVRGTTTEDAELEQAVQKVQADAKKPDAAGASAASTNTPAGVQGDAKKPAGAAAKTDPENTAGSATAPATNDAAPLDYQKDVHPLLVQVGKKGREVLVGLLKDFGAARGTDLKADQYPAVVEAARKLAA